MGVIARQSIKGALANYLGVAIGFVTTFFVVTRYLTTEEVGLTRVMVDAATLFSSLAMLGCGSSLVRFFPWFKTHSPLSADGGATEESQKIPFHGVFGLAVLLPMVGFTLFGLAFLLFRGQLLEVYGKESPLLTNYFYLIPMLTFFALYLTMFETCASVLMRITMAKMVREVGIRAFNLIAYLLYGYDLIDLDTFVWFFCGSYGLAMLLNVFYFYRISGIKFKELFKVDWHFLKEGGRWKEMLYFTLFVTMMALMGNVPLMSSLFLGAKTGLGVTGVYTIAFFIANVVEVPYRSLGAISRPVIAGAVKEGNWAEVNRLSREVSLHQLLVSLLIFLVIWINLDALFELIPNGADYKDGKWVVFILGMAKVINSSLSISSDVMNFSRSYLWLLPLSAVLLVSAIGLNMELIDVWGINGAASATLMSYLLYYVLLLSMLWWRVKVSVFSVGQLKVLAVIGLCFALGHAWSLWLTPLTGAVMGGIAGLLFDAALKTMLIGGLAAVAVYGWRVSTTVNEIVKKTLHIQ